MDQEKIVRPTADFPPSVWGDYFIAHSPSPSKLENSSQRIEELKTEVKTNFKTSHDLAEILRLIDDLQRLGLEYHFEEEINESLSRIQNDDGDSDDITVVPLCFRLLRQQGYNVSSDVFKQFRDEGGKFKQELSCDVKGLLYLYEAGLLGTREDEILDEAMDFARVQLEHLMERVDDEGLAARIKHELEVPFYRSVRRLAARHFIESYQKEGASSPVLLELARLDYNLVQSLHQSEIKVLSLWWKELGLSEKLSFARERVVECYFWSMGVHWEPKYSHGRVLLAKLMILMTVTDDMFDAYGTVGELQLFNDTVQRWDLQEMDRLVLPECIKAYIKFFKSVVKEMEDEMIKKGTLHHRHYLIEPLKDYVRGYFVEAIWADEGYTPTLKEYLQISLFTSGYILLICATPIIHGEDLTTDALEWAVKVPKIVEISAKIARLMDDVVSFEFEQKRKHVASGVQCYMKEHGVMEEEACTELNKMVADGWKDMNKEWIDDPDRFKMYFNKLALDYARVIEVTYKHEDTLTHPSGEMKKNIASLLVHLV